MKTKNAILSVAVIGMLFTPATLFADSWVLKPEVKDTEYKFGDTRVLLHYDSTKDRRFPKYDLVVYAKDQLLATHENIGFEQVFADPQNAFFLGVSNRGLIKQAYVIFDRQGQIIKEQKHDPKKVHYTDMSVTLLRKWYDAIDPQPEFVVKDGKLSNVRIRASDGKTLSLMD